MSPPMHAFHIHIYIHSFIYLFLIVSLNNQQQYANTTLIAVFNNCPIASTNWGKRIFQQLRARIIRLFDHLIDA